MNRNYISLLFIFLITIGVGFFVYSKQLNNSKKSISPIELIPQDFTSEILEIASPSKNLEELFNTNLLWKEIESESKLKQIEKFWSIDDSVFSDLKTSAIGLVSFDNKINKDLFFILEFENEPVTFESKQWKTKVIGNNLLMTEGKDFSELIESNTANESVEDAPNFISIYKTKGSGNGKMNIFKKDKGSWSVTDLTFLPEQIFANGFVSNTTNSRPLKQRIDLSILSLIPAEFETIKLIHFDSVNQLEVDSSYLDTKAKSCNCDINYAAFSWIESPAVYFESQYQNAKYTIFKLTSITDFKDRINRLLPDSLMMNLEDNKVVRTLENSFEYNSVFNSKMKYNYFVRVDDYVMFSEEKINLERLLFQQFSNFTIDEKEDLFSFLKNNINERSKEVVVTNGLNYWDFDLKSGIGIAQKHIESETLKYESVLYSKEINLDGGRTNPKWQIDFESPLLNPIYVVNNHRTQDKDYIVQDVNNVIYFITPNGEIKWKRNIGNPILGKIKNIDILGNNKYQLIFNTYNQLYILDVLGRNVTHFPVTVLDTATANVSVMNYDKDLNFRFLIPTTKGIKSINKQGEIVKGWSQPKQNNRVEGDINHLLVNTLDYITVQDSKGKLYFYNRKGEVRHSVKNTFNNNIHILYGSSIEQTRAIYFDSVTNSIKRQFFSDKPISVLLNPEEKIKEFFFVDYDQDNNRDFVLVFDTKVEIYGQDLIIQKKIELPQNISQFEIWKGGYGFLNQFNDFTVTQGEETKIIEGANGYRIDFYKNKIRAIIKGDSTLKLLHI